MNRLPDIGQVSDLRLGDHPGFDAWFYSFCAENNIEHGINPSGVASPEQLRFMVAMDERQVYAPCSDATFRELAASFHLRSFPPRVRSQYIAAWRSIIRVVRYEKDRQKRRDVTPDVIADCKYRIDRLNQERNDRIERVDACLVALLSPLLPASPAPHINTESLGMAIDRLSILSLKIWHMDEQVRRTDVTPEHIASCEKKLAVLKEQRADLSLAVKHLVTEFVEGAKTPKLYFQFKMYNDPTLNPELYGK